MLADDLYNTFAMFAFARKYNFELIVPGKRVRHYKVIKEIIKGDEIVEIKKRSQPGMVTDRRNIT